MAWIPLQPTPIAHGALGFFAGSHRDIRFRSRQYPVEQGLAAWAACDERLRRDLTEAGCAHRVSDFALGDLSFHALRTFHAAGPNLGREPRRIAFTDADMVLTEPCDAHERHDLDLFAPDVEPGQVLDSPFTPIVYDRDRDG